jgi:hypothetical protein
VMAMKNAVFWGVVFDKHTLCHIPEDDVSWPLLFVEFCLLCFA